MWLSTQFPAQGAELLLAKLDARRSLPKFESRHLICSTNPHVPSAILHRLMMKSIGLLTSRL